MAKIMGDTYCPLCGKKVRKVRGSLVGTYLCERCRWAGTRPLKCKITYADFTVRKE